MCRGGEGASTEHYTLCRCGASKNKPFCDGSHWRIKFQDNDNSSAPAPPTAGLMQATIYRIWS
ncbi:MAG: hypothetical protein E2O37_01575 [Proteobacteria bacterium]|nr:MAG: hypothetical protein E2O37_01575 [Pseudomonadota bacterium]TDJ70042.1 MAG: hypothetical protein E2O38_12365 [Pseudomonadota bacterium]